MCGLLLSVPHDYIIGPQRTYCLTRIPMINTSIRTQYEYNISSLSMLSFAYSLLLFTAYYTMDGIPVTEIRYSPGALCGWTFWNMRKTLIFVLSPIILLALPILIPTQVEQISVVLCTIHFI